MSDTNTAKAYVITFASLLVLTLATVGAAYLNLGAFNTPVALLIAGLKSALVIVFFMHLPQADRSIAISLSAGLVLLMVMIVYTVADLLTRLR